MGVNVNVQWNPGWQGQLQRQAIRTMTGRFAQALRGVRCPDHGQHPHIVGEGSGWRIIACCPKAAKLGEAAVAAALR